MVVISIIGVLLAMFLYIRPDPTRYVTQSRIQRLQIAIETYHESFYVYPHTLFNGYSPGPNSLQGPYTLPEMLQRKDLRRRDGKSLDAFFDPEDDTEIENDATGKPMFFLDGWDRRMVYYSGAHLVKAMDPTPNAAGDSPQMIPTWLKLAGKIDASTSIPSVAGRYRAEDYYFLGSAGKDGFFGWGVCKSLTNDPNDYSGDDFTTGHDLPPLLDEELALDDTWNYNLGQN